MSFFKIIGFVTAGLGMLAVMIGAFGAHALKGVLEANGRTDTFHTATQYHFYHVLALLLIYVLGSTGDYEYLKTASILMIAGILIFSGSLYILCVTNISILGAITPLGGLAFIGGWFFLLLSIFKS